MKHFVPLAMLVTALAGATAAVPTLSAAPDQSTSRPAGPVAIGAVYTLATCPVSGGKLGSMGDPVVRQYEGREVRFCCEGCIGKFEANQAQMWTKVDEQLIAEQSRFYPTDTCLVSGEPLVEDGADVGVNFITGNRLMRLCCKGCVRKVKRDPAPYLKKLDAAIVKQQKDTYPIKVCVVSGEPLDADAVEVIAGNRLFRFCCKGCVRSFKKNPAPTVAKIDEAWMAKHRGGAAGE